MRQALSPPELEKLSEVSCDCCAFLPDIQSAMAFEPICGWPAYHFLTRPDQGLEKFVLLTVAFYVFCSRQGRLKSHLEALATGDGSFTQMLILIDTICSDCWMQQ